MGGEFSCSRTNMHKSLMHKYTCGVQAWSQCGFSKHKEDSINGYNLKEVTGIRSHRTLYNCEIFFTVTMIGWEMTGWFQR